MSMKRYFCSARKFVQLCYLSQLAASHCWNPPCCPRLLHACIQCPTLHPQALFRHLIQSDFLLFVLQHHCTTALRPLIPGPNAESCIPDAHLQRHQVFPSQTGQCWHEPWVSGKSGPDYFENKLRYCSVFSSCGPCAHLRLKESRTGNWTSFRQCHFHSWFLHRRAVLQDEASEACRSVSHCLQLQGSPDLGRRNRHPWRNYIQERLSWGHSSVSQRWRPGFARTSSKWPCLGHIQGT